MDYETLANHQNSKGFSLPIVCGCKEAGMVAGCNLDLKAMNGGCGVHTEVGTAIILSSIVFRESLFTISRTLSLPWNSTNSFV